MKIQKWKRAVIFLLILFFCNVLICCQKKQETKENLQQIQEKSLKTEKKVFYTEKLSWDDEIFPEYFNTICCQNDTVFLTGQQKGKTWLYSIDIDGKTQKKKIGKLGEKEIKCMKTDGQGNYRMILSKSEQFHDFFYINHYYYVEYKEMENKLEQTWIWELEDSAENQISVIDLTMDQILVVYSQLSYEDNVTRCTGIKTVVYDINNKSKSKLNRKYTMDGNLGDVLDQEDIWKFSGKTIEKWNIAENKKILEFELDIDLNEELKYFVRTGEKDQDIYFANVNGIYGFSEKGSPEFLIEWLEHDISGNDITCFGGNEEILFVGTRSGELYQIIKGIKKKNLTEEREIITIATTDKASNIDFTMNWIRAFNNSQEQYLARLSTYGKYENPEERLRLDVLSGKGPDVLLVVSETGNMLDLLDKQGGLEDLYSYMDRDKDISREDFVKNALRLLETDGKLTRIAENFTVHALIGKKDFIGNRKSWTWKEFVECCKEIPEDEYPYIGGVDDIFIQAFPSIYPQYIDLITGKLSLKDGDFVKDKSLSEQIWKGDMIGNGKKIKGSIEERREKVKKGEIYVCSFSMSYLPFVLQPDFCSMEKPQKLVLIGYPSNTGTGVSLSYKNQYAITSFSEHKEGAWQFIKSVLMTDAYSCAEGLPLRKDHLELNKKCMMAEEDYIDENGVQIFSLGIPNNYYVTEEDIDMVEQLVERADCKMLADSHPVRQIVEEELYRQKQKDGQTLEQTVEYIESRLKIYLSEQK